MLVSMGLSYLSSITSHFVNILYCMVFNFFYCVTVKIMIWSLLYIVQPNFNALSNVAKAFGNIANAFENNYSALESVSNGFKSVTHFQSIFQHIFNAFSTYLLSWVFKNRVTNSLTHPTETAIRHLVWE